MKKQGAGRLEVALSPVVLISELHRLPDLGYRRDGIGAIEGVAGVIIVPVLTFELLRAPVLIALHETVPGLFPAGIAGRPGENSRHRAVGNILGFVKSAFAFFDARLQIDVLLHVRILLLALPLPFLGSPDFATAIGAQCHTFNLWSWFERNIPKHSIGGATSDVALMMIKYHSPLWRIIL